MEALYLFLENAVKLIIQPLIGLLFALALVYFLWGAAQFVLNSGESQGREKGKKAMVWGLVGLFIMTAVFGILSIITNTFGVALP